MQPEPKKLSLRLILLLAAIPVLILFVLLPLMARNGGQENLFSFLPWNRGAHDVRATFMAPSTGSPERQLASRDTGRPIGDNDPLVAKFATMLDNFQQKTRGTTRQGIANALVDCQNSLADKAQPLHLMEIGTDLLGRMPDSGKPYDLTQVITAYIAQRTHPSQGSRNRTL